MEVSELCVSVLRVSPFARSLLRSGAAADGMHGVIIAVLVIIAIAAIKQLTQQYWQHVPERLKQRFPRVRAAEPDI
jgi:hypothetical protein